MIEELFSWAVDLLKHRNDPEPKVRELRVSFYDVDRQMRAAGDITVFVPTDLSQPAIRRFVSRVLCGQVESEAAEQIANHFYIRDGAEE